MKSRFWIFFVSAFISISFISCGENEEPVNTIVLTDDDIIGKWVFTEVSAEATISGVPQSSTDNNPSGFVEFFADYTGMSEFDTELIGFPFVEMHSITWERVSDNQVNLTPEDGVVDQWTVTSLATDAIEANWEIDFGSIGRATIYAKMIRG